MFVEAAARLHFGVLDLRGSLGRWFGGLGAAASAPTLLLSAVPADTVDVEGADADRAAEFARRFQAHWGLRRGARIRVHRALPAHAGLGSGTQLALAVARAMAAVYDLDGDAAALARAVGRARRSAIGTWTFAGGGLIVEGGRRQGSDEVGPLVARLPFPPSWRCVLAVPRGVPGISGAVEDAAFAALPPPPEHEVARVAHLVLMGVLPAVASGDLRAFGAAITEIQQINGRWFAPVQGGPFAPGPGEALVRRMQEWGASGVGQSSWGPAVYGIVEGAEQAAELAARVGQLLDGHGEVFEGPFRAEGARVWRVGVT
ncbi:MAG TPA: beta-ribofuranosylaminobenzene 5'-phosphate synthase family protein [Candidatus Tectomicrobia bacterium]|nr:beta-ribofuranosylaminobenzene 5'-phosphate synthase family protein [Candidatus Tectomicrobia bacterium]